MDCFSDHVLRGRYQDHGPGRASIRSGITSSASAAVDGDNECRTGEERSGSRRGRQAGFPSGGIRTKDEEDPIEEYANEEDDEDLIEEYESSELSPEGEDELDPSEAASAETNTEDDDEESLEEFAYEDYYPPLQLGFPQVEKEVAADLAEPCPISTVSPAGAGLPPLGSMNNQILEMASARDHIIPRDASWFVGRGGPRLPDRLNLGAGDEGRSEAEIETEFLIQADQDQRTPGSEELGCDGCVSCGLPPVVGMTRESLSTGDWMCIPCVLEGEESPDPSGGDLSAPVNGGPNSSGSGTTGPPEGISCGTPRTSTRPLNRNFPEHGQKPILFRGIHGSPVRVNHVPNTHDTQAGPRTSSHRPNDPLVGNDGSLGRRTARPHVGVAMLVPQVVAQDETVESEIPEDGDHDEVRMFEAVCFQCGQSFRVRIPVTDAGNTPDHEIICSGCSEKGEVGQSSEDEAPPKKVRTTAALTSVRQCTEVVTDHITSSSAHTPHPGLSEPSSSSRFPIRKDGRPWDPVYTTQTRFDGTRVPKRSLYETRSAKARSPKKGKKDLKPSLRREPQKTLLHMWSPAKPSRRF